MLGLLPFLLYLGILSPARGYSPEGSLQRMVFVLITQEHNDQIAQETEKALKDALRASENTFFDEEEEEEDWSNIILTGREAPFHGSWTFFPLFPFLQEEFKGDYDWFIFLNENSRLNGSILKALLTPYSPDDPLFIGHALRDKDHTVIHHYDPPGFEYPAWGSGFVLSFKLVQDLASRITKYGLNLGKFPSSFSIDPLYELANVIRHSHLDNVSDEHSEDILPTSQGPLLTHSPLFCLDDSSLDSCATYSLPDPVCPLMDVLDRTLFAVKTTESFHTTRLNIIRDTWGKAAPHIIYASEKSDPSIPTVSLPGTINTQNGHCQKTSSIIQHFNAHTAAYDWLVIADDDTLLSVQKIGETLACYDPSKPIALGQRYGFRVATGEYGYDYITGGGGMIFSRSATKKMFSSPEYCTCPKPDFPDDMHLGSCMSNIGSPIVHHQGFHQARPEDYDEKLLKHQRPLSFHKFINTDPLKTYRTWFSEADKELSQMNSRHLAHEEL